MNFVASVSFAIALVVGKIAAVEINDGRAARNAKELLRREVSDMPPSQVLEVKRDTSSTGTVVDELTAELYGDVSPYRALETGTILKHVDMGYPHSNLKPDIVEGVLRYTGDPRFWLEVGSFIGNSAITTAKVAKANTSVICMDPFTGDNNMWDWNRGRKGPGGFNFEEMDADGTTRIYDTFLSNIQQAGFQAKVLPVRVTSMAGMRLLKRLHSEGRLRELPRVIYLDSAHEKDETLMELQTAYDLLPDGGVLFGDDWGWQAVRDDVLRFAAEKKLSPLSNHFTEHFGKAALTPAGDGGAAGVALIEGQWLIPKLEEAAKEKKIQTPN